jgi:hypothetical protein
VLASPCAGHHRGGAGSKRRGWGSLPQMARGNGGARTIWCQQWEEATERAQWEGARGTEVSGGGER